MSYVDRMQLGSAFVNHSGDVMVKFPSVPVFLVLSDPLLLTSLDTCSDNGHNPHTHHADVFNKTDNKQNRVYRQLSAHSVDNPAQAMIQVGTWNVRTQKFHSAVLVTVSQQDTDSVPEVVPSFQEVQNVVATLSTQLYAASSVLHTRQRKRLCATLE